MPPAPHEYHGLDAIRTFLHTAFDYRGDRTIHLLPTKTNSQLAYGAYLRDPGAPAAEPSGLFVLTMAGHHIHALTRFHIDPRYDLPTRRTSLG